MVRVRFAPSPTGQLHLGNARTALINALFAARGHGAFILRIDDTDTARSEERFVELIHADLRWLGLAWAEEHRQSLRTATYEARLGELIAAGAVYACEESEAELAAWRTGGKNSVYKRGSFTGGPGPRYWRLDLGRRPITFDDLVHGPVTVDAASLSDPVVRRGDGSFTFLFASAVDDADLAITHVIRGADHLTNTGIQIALTTALGATPPAFAHLPLILDAEGHSLSKRTGSISVGELAAHGIEPLAVAQLLATLGTGRAPDPEADLKRLARDLDLGAFGRAQPRLDPAQLDQQSAAVVRHFSFGAVRDRLPAGADEPFWLAVRPNLDRVADAAEWWDICHRPLTPVIEDSVVCRRAADLLPDPVAYDDWIAALRKATEKKGRELFHPLRLALTARERGPELKALLTLLPRETVLRRLRGQTA